MDSLQAYCFELKLNGAQKRQCGQIATENRKTLAQFKFVPCGNNNHADTVGSINILEHGQCWLDGGDLMQLDWSVKQEPTEATYALAA